MYTFVTTTVTLHTFHVFFTFAGATGFFGRSGALSILFTHFDTDHSGAIEFEEYRGPALRWALARGVRSGRTAQHFARHWVGQQLLQRSENPNN